ncbi:MAG: hypothetical protein A2Y78_14850 [Acidobacteria bacterium RBG_13_68_16]|nr:MAG: hypothetical protein A2Y78_14850 [Acidobacteria bacterium RBG_13_68_16]
MNRARVLAALPWAAFALLGLCIAWVGGVPGIEVVWASASVGAALLPSGFIAPSGWRRRAAEALLLPAALALVLVGDPTMRRMMLPPLLLLVAAGATAAAFPRASERARPFLVAALALAARAGGGLGLVGFEWWHITLVLAVAAALAWGTTRLAGGFAGASCGLLAGTLPLETAPLWVPLALLAAAAASLAVPRAGAKPPRLAGWLPGATALALVAASLAPWGGIAPSRAFPHAGWAGAAAPLAALAITPFLPGAFAGAAWLAATVTLAPVRPPPPDRPAVEVTAASPEVALPLSAEGVYVLDLTLANAAEVQTGTTVATVLDAGAPLALRAGVDTAEWSHERPDVRPHVAHTLPRRPVWRPGEVGSNAVWGVAGRTEARLSARVRPRLVREATLPPQVVLVAAAAGTEQPTPPRDWPLPMWILAAGIAVALVQVASRTWRRPAAALPWVLLTAASLLARLPVEPLRLVGERHGVDIALAATLSAWLPAAAAWLRRRRGFVTAAALLVPIALATPHLTPPLYGDEPFHLIVLESLTKDHDLDLANNYDLEHRPYNRIYMGAFIQPPVLGMFLLPGYLVGGRTGALALLALAGAALVALITRRALELGCPPTRVALLAMVLLVTHPLATFSTQIWVEIPAALATIAAVVLLALPRPRRGGVAVLAALTTAVKARLGLIMFPLVLVGWWPARLRIRDVRRAVLVLVATAGVGLAASWATFGHPLGYRRLSTLVPESPGRAVTVLGGLLFDPAGGLAFAAPLLLLALAGAATLWRRGGNGERALLAGGVATVVALLHSHEWYGGGSPPARYLVPLLPAFALAGAMVLRTAPRWRRLAWVLLPPSVLVWWTLVTRPHFSVNSGDGGWWLADALARRFAGDVRHLIPSFLRPSPATFLVPLGLVALVVLLVLSMRAHPAFARGLARATTVVWLAGAATAVLAVTQRTDHVVDLEDPQVEKIGGRLEPPPGTFSRFSYPNGWRVADAEGVVVPLNLPQRAGLALVGWLDGPSREGAALLVSWDGAAPTRVPVSGQGTGSVPLPGVPGAGRHALRITLQAPPGGEAVLDRLMVER